MKISYLVTCSTEKESLNNLVIDIQDALYNNEDELIILYDESATNNDYTKKLLSFFDTIEFKMEQWGNRVKVVKHSLNADYGNHKNYGNEKCSGDWIFQIDGDELPPTTLLGENLKLLIESNPTTELYFVPRINDFKGVNNENAAPWGWRLSKSPFCEGRLIVNWPDYQGRIYRNIPDRIKWDRRLHEKIVGHNEYGFLPEDEMYALYHDKTIEKQLETNKRYNTLFTQEENQGHKVR